MNITEVIPNVQNVSSCASLCNDLQSCLSFDYSGAETNCILHDNIEGPRQEDFFENIFSTPELQRAETYFHYEKLGVGNSTIVTFSNLSLEHDTVYFINMRLRNRLGYESVVSSDGFLVDLTPPLPGVIAAVNSSVTSIFPGGCSSADVPILGCLDPVTSRAGDM